MAARQASGLGASFSLYGIAFGKGRFVPVAAAPIQRGNSRSNLHASGCWTKSTNGNFPASAPQIRGCPLLNLMGRAETRGKERNQSDRFNLGALLDQAFTNASWQGDESWLPVIGQRFE